MYTSLCVSSPVTFYPRFSHRDGMKEATRERERQGTDKIRCVRKRHRQMHPEAINKYAVTMRHTRVHALLWTRRCSSCIKNRAGIITVQGELPRKKRIHARVQRGKGPFLPKIPLLQCSSRESPDVRTLDGETAKNRGNFTTRTNFTIEQD